MTILSCNIFSYFQILYAVGSDNLSLGLCLSGGGVKGAAHIGALQALIDNNISIDYISGTSSGSIVATLYAVGYSPNEIYKIFKKHAKDITGISILNIIKLVYGLFFRHTIIIQGLNSGIKLEKIIHTYCEKKGVYNINQIKFPLCIPSVDIKTGNTHIYLSKEIRSKNTNNYIYSNSMPIDKVVRASCSFPGIYCPVTYKNSLLVDGGLRANIPWKETKNMGASTVLSIVFESHEAEDSFIDIFELITRSVNILSHELALYEEDGSDYILKISTNNVSLLDINKIDELYDLGYSSMTNFIKKLKI